MNHVQVYHGTLTRLYLVNPHSYLYFDVMKEGQPFKMRCEMRSATLLKRSGWDVATFKPGRHVDILAHPHRQDPHSCYLESVTIGGAGTINRNEQFSSDQSLDTSHRALTTAAGDPNITGDWAVEQLVLTVPPNGGHGALVPKHLREAYASGKITLAQIRAEYPRPSRPVYTAAGEAAAKSFKMWSTKDNPRLSCKPTSILFDWGFDWPINHIVQHRTADGENVIDITYGSYSFTRRIHLDMDDHPANLTPTRSGHSIGHWEGNTLVVDTVGFKPGVLIPPTLNSDKLHVIERFTLDPTTWSLKHQYTAEDAVYLAKPYTASDTVHLSAVPYQKYPCKELTYEFKGDN